MRATSTSEGAWRKFLQRFRPEQTSVPIKEQGLSALAAAAAVFAVMFLSMALLHAPPFVVASLGASAVLVFVLPASPLAQPWSVVGGYLVCAVAGVTAATTGWPIAVEGALAVGLAILGMFVLRCMHPPGGAVALFAVVGGETVRALGFQYVLSPVLANALLLVGVGLAVNNLMPGRNYPRPHSAEEEHIPVKPRLVTHLNLRHEDLAAAIEEHGRTLYISAEEIEEILVLAENHARRRHGG
ncbi:MAG: HPP family protein [Rhodocyclaceae bacterium]|nr:HPP family protein [Rhodocyclaceae bacterium]